VTNGQGWSCAGVLKKADRVVVLTQMIADMQTGYRTPGEVAKGHTWVVNLMDKVIEPVGHAQCLKLELAAPSTIFFYVAQVSIDGLIILNERRIHVLVFLDMFDCFLPVLLVKLLVAVQLISYRAEQAIAIPAHLDHLQPVLCELLAELGHVRLMLSFLHTPLTNNESLH
jgi:hypothetical protein